MVPQISAHADLGEITTKLKTTVSGICAISDRAMLQVASLKHLNTGLKAELKALDALRLEHVARRATGAVLPLP